MLEEKRLFFGFETEAPWPPKLPSGRLLDEHSRHMTLAFLGQADYAILKNVLKEFPLCPMKVGLTGRFDRCLFLPERHPRVVAWHVDWFDEQKPLITYQKQVIHWLKEHGFNPDDRKDFLPHVTVSRAPFNIKDWKSVFSPLPCLLRNLHLYESVGNLKYEKIWSHPSLHAPFEEIEHTADIAFRIHGENLEQIHDHAFTALAFKFPNLLSFYEKTPSHQSLEDIVAHLNEMTSKADGAIGCPYKAISYHGDIMEKENRVLEWEMIVDV